MKAKNIFRISVFAVLLCMITMLGAFAAETDDYKIIRWDGTGNVGIDSYKYLIDNAGLKVEETNGVLRVTGGDKFNQDGTYEADNYFYMYLAGGDYIDLQTYPYYVLKYKTNEAFARSTVGSEVVTQIFLGVTDNKGSKYQHTYNHSNDASGCDYTDAWRTYLYHIADDQSDVANSVSIAPPKPSEGAKLWSIRIEPARNLKDYATAKDLVLDIEYIGFFKTKVDAEAYGRNSVVIRFDGNEDRVALKIGERSATKYEITADGTIKYIFDTNEVNAEYDYTILGEPKYTFGSNSFFEFKSYPYIGIKAKSTVDIDKFQYYAVGANIFCAVNAQPSDTFQNYLFDSSNINGYTNATDTTRVSEPFIQFKGFEKTNKTEYIEIASIGHFKNAEDRAAFMSGAVDQATKTAKDAYAKIVNARSSLTVDYAGAEAVKAAATAAVTDKVSELLGDDDVTVTYAADYAEGDTACKVIVTLTAKATYDTDKTYTATKAVGFDVKVNEKEFDAKIIRFNADGTPVVNAADGTSKMIEMPAESAYDSVSASPRLDLGDSKFELSEYPYVKIKIRTNHTGWVQFYVTSEIIDGSTYYNRADLYRYSGGNNNTAFSNGEWHEIEFSFNDKNFSNDCYLDAATKTNKPYVSLPFFQFKELDSTPSGDMFAEIEYIGFFKTKEEMKAYGREASFVLVTGEELYNHSAAKNTSATLEDGGIYRINSTGETTDVNVTNLLKDVYGNNVDLYEYPYAKMKFRTNYQNTLQLYVSDANYRFVVYLNDSISGKENKFTDWHNATLSYSTADISRWGSSNETRLSNNGYTWVVVDTSNNRSKFDYSFPVEADKYRFSGFKFQVKGGYQAGGYLDIAYIAFYKDKETMLNDTTYDDAVQKIDTAIEAASECEFKLHQAVGAIAVEDYVKNMIEESNSGISVAANAVNFNYNNETCDVEVVVSYGEISKTAMVKVSTPKLGTITLENLGAQIRNKVNDDIPDGLRFGTKLDYNAEEYEIVEFGTLIIPKLCRTTKALEKASLNGSYGVGTKDYKKNGATYYQKPVNCNGGKIYTFDDGTANIFTGVLTKITEEYKDVALDARPYVTYTLVGDESGKKFTYYGDVIERSWNQVKTAVEAEKANEIVGIGEDSKWSNTTND